MGTPDAAQSDQTDQFLTRTPRLRHWRWKRTLAGITIAYLGICAGLALLETRLVFPGAYMGPAIPADDARFDPAQPTVGMVTTLVYPAIDGAELRGRLLVRENPQRAILFLHGNGIRAVNLDRWTQQLSKTADATVLTAEYRGFQNDGFTPTESTTIADADSAIQALAAIAKVPPSKITIYGRSLGGGIAAGLVDVMQARGEPVTSVILDRTFDSVTSVAADRFPWLPVPWLIRNRFESTQRLANFRGNVVQVHGTPDRIVPMKNGRQLFAALTTANRTWIEVPGWYHNDPMSKPMLREVLEALNVLELRHTVSTTDP